MVSTPDSGTSESRRPRATTCRQPARVRITPRPVLPTPIPSSSETSQSSRTPRAPLPTVRVPVFPQSSRPQGKKKKVQDAAPPASPRHRVTKKARHAYTAREKLYWLDMLDTQPDLSIQGLARLANVQPKQIREWRKLKERLLVSAASRRRLVGAGRKAKWPFMERAVYRQFLAHRAKGLAVSVSMLQKWSRQYMKHRHPRADWRGSNCWSFRFRVRWSLAKRVKTKMGQMLADSESYFPVVCEFDVVPRLNISMFSLLADLKAKVESFWEFVRQMQVLNSYPTSLIVNSNQTPLFLEMPQEHTLEMKGARTVHVRTAGYEKERLTVMLPVTASGLKLPPYVVFERKTIPKVKVPRGESLLPLRMLLVPLYMRMMCIMRCAGVVIRAQLWGWMDENLVQDWTTQVLVPFMRPLRDEGCSRKDVLLVLDSYQGHLTEAVGQTMRLFRLTRAVIPGGCTQLVQPLDVSINHAFKAGVQHRYGIWFEEDRIRSTTPAGEPLYETIPSCCRCTDHRQHYTLQSLTLGPNLHAT
ncbi:unnamed protein product [Closterium sp. NIES-54]